MKKATFSIFVVVLFFQHYSIGQIPRDQVINNAASYVNFTWTASACNLNPTWNGQSCGGRSVYSADAAWVNVGANTSMPYMWGGWSTQTQHNTAMANCKAAGDICSTMGGGCSGNGAGLSCASGHDCSGLVSRAWALSTKQSTTTLPSLCSQIGLTAVQSGDIVNKSGDHSRLIETNYGNGNYRVIEASGADWKTSYRTYTANALSSYIPLKPNSSIVSNTACTAVQITQHPSNQTKQSGQTATFNITVSGTPPFRYFWYKNGNVIAGPIDNSSNTSSYTTPTLSTSNNGDTYFAVAFNCENWSEQKQSNTAVLTVTGPCSNPTLDHQSANWGPSAMQTTSGDDIILTAQPGCTFSVSENCNWVTVLPTSGTTNSNGQALINYELTANASTTQRVCTLNISGKDFVIKQNGCSSNEFYPVQKNVHANGSTYNLDVDSDDPCSWNISNPVSWVHISQSSGTGRGTIAVTVSANNECFQRTCTLIVNPGNGTHIITQEGNGTALSTPGNISGNKTVCSGNMETYSVNAVAGATSYTWSYTGGGTPSGTGTSVTFQPTSNGTLSVTANNNCSSSNSSNISINVNSPPSADFNSDKQSGITPLSVTFFDASANEPSTWQWIFPGGNPHTSSEQNPTITYQDSGIFDVVLKVSNPCGNTTITKSNHITVLATTTGIDEIEQSAVLQIYPNPNHGKFRISADVRTSKLVQIRILSSIGKLIYTSEIQPVGNRIEKDIMVNNITSGTYLVQLLTDKNTLYKKLVVE